MAESTSTSSPAPAFRKEISDQPLPEILVTIGKHRVPGVLECYREGKLVRIFIDGENVAFVSSSDPADSLRAWLLRQGSITQRDHDECAAKLCEGGRSEKALLIESGALEPRVLLDGIRDQVRSVVTATFAWEEGEVTFLPGKERLPETARLRIPIPEIVRSGVRTLPEARAIVARMGGRLAIIRCEAPTDGATFSEDEKRLLDRIENKTTLYELVQTPPLSQSDNAKILYGLFALQHVSIKPPKGIKVQLKMNE